MLTGRSSCWSSLLKIFIEFSEMPQLSSPNFLTLWTARQIVSILSSPILLQLRSNSPPFINQISNDQRDSLLIIIYTLQKFTAKTFSTNSFLLLQESKTKLRAIITYLRTWCTLCFIWLVPPHIQNEAWVCRLQPRKLSLSTVPSSLGSMTPKAWASVIDTDFQEQSKYDGRNFARDSLTPKEHSCKSIRTSKSIKIVSKKLGKNQWNMKDFVLLTHEVP